MRFLSSLLAFLLGLAALAIGIGQLTVWAPQETVTAHSPELEDAPLTVITDGVVDLDDGREEFTLEAEGEYTIALARLDDIEAWVDDAAHVQISGVDEPSPEQDAQVVAEHVAGESEVPDPSDSDLWVATETAEGPLVYRWVAPDDSGDWALMIFRDGEEPAPSAVAVEVEQPVDSTWGIALIIVGGLLILLALVLFYRALAARRKERDVLAAAYDGEVVADDDVPVAAGTDSAAETETTASAEALDDEAPEGTAPEDTAPEGSAPEGNASEGEATEVDEPEADEPGVDEPGVDEPGAEEPTTVVPAVEAPSSDVADDEAADTAAETAADTAAETDPALADAEVDPSPREADEGADAEGATSADEPSETETDEPADAHPEGDEDDEEVQVTEPTAESPEPRRRSFWWRSSSVALLAAVAVPAVSGVDIAADLQAAPEEEQAEDEAAEDAAADAEDAEDADDSDGADDGEAADEDAEEGAEEGGTSGTGEAGDLPEAGEYSVLLESQLQRIVDDIAEVVEAGDEEQDVDVLQERVAGNAFEVRELTYRNQEIADGSASEPVGSEVLAAAVTSSGEFPRQAVVITRHEDSEIPQVLVIEQESARDNYRLTQAVMMMPGTEFPAISAEEGGVVPVDPDAEVARFAPDFAMVRTAVFLNNRDYYFGMHVEDNPYIEDLQSYQEEVQESAADIDISYTRPLAEEGTTALRLPDGSVLAVGSFDSTMQLRPHEPGDQIIFEDETLAELAGTSSTTADADVVSRESMILHIPAEDEDPVVLLGVHDIVNDVHILD